MMRFAQVAALIPRAYHLGVSPLLPPSCRFHPSCSTYASDAILRFGFVRGVPLALKRLSKCHPWHDGGYDPVPGIPRTREAAHTEREIG